MPKKKSDPKEAWLYLAENALIVFVLFVMSFSLNTYLSNNFQVLGASSETIYNDPGKLRAELRFWDEIVRANPTYKDGYLELVDIYDRLGDSKKAQFYREAANRN